MAIIARLDDGAANDKEQTGATAARAALAKDIVEALRVLFPGHLGDIELRAIRVARVGSTATHNEHARYPATLQGFARLAKDARDLTRRAEGVYVTLNPVRVEGEDQSRAATDADVVRRVWFLVDVDPVRPAGTSATDAEKAFALSVARKVRDYLRSQAWPEPILADSGNGYHLDYRIDLPNDNASRDLIQRCLQALAAKFDTPEATVDRSVYNASRICKLYGTLARKGDSTEDRPHRASGIAEVPKSIEVVPIEWLLALAREAPEANGTRYTNLVEAEAASLERVRELVQPNGNGNGTGNGHAPANRVKGLIARDNSVDPVEAFGRQGLDNELAKLGAAVPGTRNATLFASAAAVFGLVAAGALDEGTARGALEVTSRGIGLGDAEISTTLRSARKAGFQTPRDLSHVGKADQPGSDEGEAGGVVVEAEAGRKEFADDPRRLACLFLARHHGGADRWTLAFHADEWHRWKDGAWFTVPASDVEGDVARFMMDELGAIAAEAGKTAKRFTATAVRHTLLALRALVTISTEDVPDRPAWTDGNGPDPRECLPTRSGILHLPTVLKDGHDKPGAIFPPTPRFFSANALRYAFDPFAPEPVEWTRFLRSVFPTEPDRTESVDCLQQWFGYLLTPDTRYQKILMVVGPRRCGKGTIVRTLRDLIGAVNLAAPTLSSLGGQFGVQPLIGKSVCVCPESRIAGRTDTQAIVERLLSISGEDPQSVERKHLATWNGTIRARFVLLGNELPRLGDYSSALPGRLVVLAIKESFFGREDLDLGDRLAAELPEILNWSLQGWKKLREQGGFTQPASGAELLREFDELANPLAVFVGERCTLGQGLEVPVQDLYREWCDWCATQGRDRPGDVQGFSRNLRTSVQSLTIRRLREGENRTRVFHGIALRGGPR
jgi:putative DNA primase/helicase